MYIAINKSNPNEHHSFTWTADDKLIINGHEANPNDWDIVEIQGINYYIDIDGKDRSQERENTFTPTLEDIQNDPRFYAELVNDLMFHWMYGTRETPLMVEAKRNYLKGYPSMWEAKR